MTALELFRPDRWASVPRQALFLLSALPLALVVPVTIISLVSIGAGLAVLGVGILLLLGAAAFSRWFGHLELRRLAWTGALPIEAPDWPELDGQFFLTQAQVVLLDRRQWSYIAHSVLYLIMGTITGSLMLAWIGAILNGATRWAWNGWATTPAELANAGIHIPALFTVPAPMQGPIEILVYTVIGAAALVSLPWFTALMVGLHDRVARVFLARFSPDELDVQMAGLRRSRQSGVAAEGRTLRKLERDLHDGPQQQLLRLQMDLAAAGRKMQSDPESAKRLLEDAGRRSAETLAELRQLVRGIAPPILQDRGLAAALSALAERSSIPTQVICNLDPAVEIEAAVQQGIYFVTAELLANAVKHSGARHITITCHSARSVLVLEIEDDGDGGAREAPGHGLAGIAERVDGLGGTSSVTSPQGGPTRIIITIEF
jgi:signal transduction histidine kinase